MYYRVFDGYDYLHAGYNTTSEEELKEDILDYLEQPDSDDYKNCSIQTIAEVCQLTIETSEEPFEDLN